MYDFFYRFHKKPLAYDLYTVETEDGTPSPPLSEFMITENGESMATENDILMITE